MGHKKALIIDFNNLFYASYHTEALTNTKGQNVQGIKGFFFRLKSLKDQFNPDYIIICRDVSRTKTFRKEMYPLYKGNRKPMESDALFQMQETLRILSLMGYPIFENERYEADDLIGMTSAFNSDNDIDSIVVSADRDLYQLIDSKTKIWSFKRNEIIDIDYLNKKYGLKPSQWVDLKILQGDRSDNIPGVEGIGEKTAERLMKTFGSISNIYGNMDLINGKIKQNLLQCKSMLPMTRTLVTILRDYTLIELDENKYNRKETYPDEVYNAIAELEIPSIINVIKYDLLPIVNYGAQTVNMNNIPKEEN